MLLILKPIAVINYFFAQSYSVDHNYNFFMLTMYCTSSIRQVNRLPPRTCMNNQETK